jgi:pyruvate,water dikinase
MPAAPSPAAAPPRLMVNVSVPALAASAARLPAAGVGLLRAEFLCLHAGRHPQLLLEEGGADAYVDFFKAGLREVASAFHPRPVTYRASDLKSHEYRALEGGDRFEPEEPNGMLGRRGVFRYLERPEEFALELRAISEVRAEGLDAVRLMLPFVRTVAELREVRALVDAAGLTGQPGFQLWAMAEVPAVALLPEAFAAEVDGLSIGSNDLTQLVLGVDRDSSDLAARYGPTDPAVLAAIQRIVDGGHAAGKPVSICGDGASVDPEFVRALVATGIDTISVVPHAYEATQTLIDGIFASADAPS